jgi:low molecular weight phosphotyrosine protein phosphatase
MAEAVFEHQLKQRSSEVQSRVVKVDSCGTGAYHVGDEPDERTVETCKKVRRNNESSARFRMATNRVEI